MEGVRSNRLQEEQATFLSVVRVIQEQEGQLTNVLTGSRACAKSESMSGSDDVSLLKGKPESVAKSSNVSSPKEWENRTFHQVSFIRNRFTVLWH